MSNTGASIASGSFRESGMIVAPCSIKTLSAIATSYADTLVARAADVTLKERRPLVLIGHLRLMVSAAENGALIFPSMPAFYARPASLDEVVDHTVGRALYQLGIDTALVERWSGLPDQIKTR